MVRKVQGVKAQLMGGKWVEEPVKLCVGLQHEIANIDKERINGAPTTTCRVNGCTVELVKYKMKARVGNPTRS